MPVAATIAAISGITAAATVTDSRQAHSASGEVAAVSVVSASGVLAASATAVVDIQSSVTAELTVVAQMIPSVFFTVHPADAAAASVVPRGTAFTVEAAQ
jgi:hypothetical protein